MKIPHTLSSTLSLILALAPIALSSPIINNHARAPATSPHNIYLLTCKSDTNSRNTMTGIAFFYAPVSSTSRSTPQPDESAMISSSYPWEGYTLQGPVWLGVTFTSEITKNAKSLAKGQAAGYVALGQEQFVCFKDGVTGIPLTDDEGNEWGTEAQIAAIAAKAEKREAKGRRGTMAWTTCTADYWCGSISP